MKNKKGLIITIVIIIFLVFGGVFAYFTMQNQGGTTNNMNTVTTTSVVVQNNGVTVSGVVQPKEISYLYDDGTKGKVVKALVNPGDIVSTDDKLIEFDYGYLYAKEDGRVLNIDVNATASASASASTTGSSPAAMVTMGSKDFKVVAEITEYDLANIPNNAKVQYAVRNNDLEKKYNAHLDSLPQLPVTSTGVAATTNTQITNYNLTVFLDDQPDNVLRAGYHVNVFITGDASETLSLTKTAVIQDGDKLYVYVINTTDGKSVIEKREISATSKDDVYIIQNGITQTDTVVDNPSTELVDGMEVTVQ